MSRAEPDEWGALAEQWRSTPSPAPMPIEAIRGRIRRQTVRLIVLVACEVTVTVVAVAYIAVGLLRADDWAGRILAISLLLFTARIWLFAIRNRRGIWRPSARTLEEFRVFERLRLERRLASARFTWRFCSLTLIAAAAWTVWQGPELSPRQLWLMAATAVYLLGWIVGGVFVMRRIASQLERSSADAEWRNGASLR